MNYYVARNGQTYGPYSEETIRKYLTEGSMLATDMARSDEMPNWAPLSQILGLAGGASAPPPAYSAPPPAYSAPTGAPPPYSAPQAYSAPTPVMGQMGPGGNIPPSLHWGLIILIAAFTSGLFITVWGFVQANWIRSIDPASKAVRDLAIGVCMPLIGTVAIVILAVGGGIAGQLDQLDHPSVALIGSLITGFLIFMALCLGGLIFNLKAFFGMKASMERYYNTTEPINLRLSGVMVFFFNILYFAHHMTRIADWKRTGVLRP